jgi:predicted deacylase
LPNTLKLSKRLIDITGMRDVIQRRVPVLTLDSGRPGPTVWLTACIHGDEPGGSAIVHDVFKTVRAAGLVGGTIHALPLINSMGFENVSRFINSDREDLNRCFPGNAKGTMGERIARRLFEMIEKSKPDLVIDLHNDWIQSVPYVIIEPRSHFAVAGLQKKTLAAARATGLLTVQETALSEAMARTLPAAFITAGVSAFTIEAGGACGIVESAIKTGTAAVLGVLKHLGIIATATDSVPHPASSRVLDYTSKPHCTSSGLVRFSVTPGDRVKVNQTVAQVFSAFGSIEETLQAERAGYVLGIADHARAVPGSEVIAFAATD